MALAKAVKGARHSGQTITWYKDDGTYHTLTGATITARVRDMDAGTVVDSDGSFNVTDGANGEFTWGYGATDVANAGKYEVQFKAAFAGGQYDLSYLQEWSVEDAI